MGAIDNWKPPGPSRPLVTAIIAIVLTWVASVVIFYYGVLYSVGHDFNTSVIGLAKQSTVVPIALTGVSFVAALSNWHSRIAWGAAGLQLLYFCIFFSLFFPILQICLLYFFSAYFQFRTAASIARNRRLKAGDHSYR